MGRLRLDGARRVALMREGRAKTFLIRHEVP